MTWQTLGNLAVLIYTYVHKCLLIELCTSSRHKHTVYVQIIYARYIIWCLYTCVRERERGICEYDACLCVDFSF